MPVDPNLPPLLPVELPTDPFPLFLDLYNAAHEQRITPNPNAMSLATTTDEGHPSVRIVLCKKIDPDLGFVTFFTNYESRKGGELDANPHAAVCFHWDAFDRQVRIEGAITRSPSDESDEYFNSRHPLSRIGAWASQQSRPVDSRQTLVDQVSSTMERFGVDNAESLGRDFEMPRPPHWGGYRLWAQRVEIWYGEKGRLHDRAVWSRELTSLGDGFRGSSWTATRLQP